MSSKRLKNLLVHLDQSERTPVRLAMAVSLARQHQARLTGVFGQRAKAQQVGIVATWPSAEYSDAAQAAKAAFERATAGMPQAQWHDINRGSDAELLRQITEIARCADLIVLGQHDEQAKAYVPSELAEEVVLNSGRPILVIPYAGEFPQQAQHPLIAWDNSREAAHAVNDALALIADCPEATIISVDARYAEASASCARLADHLACHGIKAKTEVLVVDDVGIMDILLSRVTDLGADLLVMGAHGSIGLPFVSRGAGTRHIFRSMVVPVLMSN
jgi:nucleotide-binding universal stress UspA family protein